MGRRECYIACRAALSRDPPIPLPPSLARGICLRCGEDAREHSDTRQQPGLGGMWNAGTLATGTGTARRTRRSPRGRGREGRKGDHAHRDSGTRC